MYQDQPQCFFPSRVKLFPSRLIHHNLNTADLALLRPQHGEQSYATVHIHKQARMHSWRCITDRDLSFSPISSMQSCRRVSWLCASSSSCAGLRIVTCLTPKRPSSACWLAYRSGRGSVGKVVRWSTACEQYADTIPTQLNNVFITIYIIHL